MAVVGSGWLSYDWREAMMLAEEEERLLLLLDSG